MRNQFILTLIPLLMFMTLPNCSGFSSSSRNLTSKTFKGLFQKKVKHKRQSIFGQTNLVSHKEKHKEKQNRKKHKEKQWTLKGLFQKKVKHKRQIISGQANLVSHKEKQNRKKHKEKQWTFKGLFQKKVKHKRQIISGQANLVSHKEKQNRKKHKEKQNWKKHIEKQWALKDILALSAWELTRGSPEIVVAVIDTGVHLKHPCLQSNLWVNTKEIPNNNKDDDGNGFIDDVHGWNFVNNNSNIQDRHGHGTHIAGIIAATGRTKNNPTCRLSGVAPNVRLMILKYYDKRNNQNNIRNTTKSIEYAIQNGANIINYSGGGPGENEAEKTAIAKANDNNILFISAAGNESAEIQDHSYYPASYGLPNIFTVQSTNSQGKILESSNWMKVDWRKKNKIYIQTAPGEDVISTLPPRSYMQSSLVKNIWRQLSSVPKMVNHNNYGYMTGTSQATAVSAGVAALIESLHPSWTPTQVIRQMNNTGFSDSARYIKEKTHQGKKLNAYEALVMRDRNIDFDDNISQPGISMPATDKASALKNLNKNKGENIDVYDPQKNRDPSKNNSLNSMSILKKIGRFISNPKK